MWTIKHCQSSRINNGNMACQALDISWINFGLESADGNSSEQNSTYLISQKFFWLTVCRSNFERKFIRFSRSEYVFSLLIVSLLNTAVVTAVFVDQRPISQCTPTPFPTCRVHRTPQHVCPEGSGARVTQLILGFANALSINVDGASCSWHLINRRRKKKQLTVSFQFVCPWFKLSVILVHACT